MPRHIPVPRLNMFSLAPKNLNGLINLSMLNKQSSLGPRLVELIHLRVSQVNGCGVCVDMHWRDLVKQGVEPRHLNTLAGWHESPFFDERERAALAWADALNSLPGRDDTDAAWPAVREHFNDTEIAELNYTVVTIRSWNVMNLSLRNPIPITPAPGM